MASDSAVRSRARPPEPTRALDLGAPELSMEEGYIQVQRTKWKKTEVLQDSTIRVPVYHTAPARVRVGGSVTRNMGDFNSIRIEASVELPCYPEATEISRAKAMAAELVDGFIRAELDRAMGNPNSEGNQQ